MTAPASFARFDPAAAPLDGVRLVEASAGTGKTWSITALILRLVAEAGRPIREILTVTFTNAATEELRDRVRTRLNAARRQAGGGPGDDAVLAAALAKPGADPAEAERRLREAVRDFDEAPIFTIHGFCQRLLEEHAFESGAAFEAEMQTDDEEWIREIADDFWLSRVAVLPPNVLAAWNGRLTPRLLVRWARERGRHPRVRIEPEPADADDVGPALARAASASAPLTELAAAMAARWATEADAIAAALARAPLHAGRYRPARVAEELKELARWTARPEAAAVPSEIAARYAPDVLGKATRRQEGEPPRHPFFDLCGRVAPLAAALDAALENLRVALLSAFFRFVEDEHRRRSGGRNVRFFQDLLTRVRDALEGPGGDALAAAVRRRYPVAIIDEFQDTDPVQYDIFRRVYEADGALFYLIGDPKQSIYAFRGADVFAYLRAARDADARYTLGCNWRSEPRLIDGLNRLFGRSPEGFVLDGIAYRAVDAPDRPNVPPLECGRRAPPAPIRVAFLPGSEAGGRGPGVREMVERAAAYTAAEIGRWLSPPRSRPRRIDGRPVEAGDIAVLVPSHARARAVEDHLRRAGIPCVVRGESSVFATREAGDVRRVLAALAEPRDDRLLRGALLTDLFGLSPADLDALANDAAAWTAQVEAFRRRHEEWRDRGLIRVFARLLREGGAARRLLSRPDGERAMTNYRHLAEQLQAEEDAFQPGLAGLLRRLDDRIASGERGDDEQQLRLESDERRVRIQTVHSSKGLEFPIVFCPFAWDGDLRRPGASEPFLFHDPDRGDEPVFDLGAPGRGRAAHLERRDREALAEHARLFYVAVTRARHHVDVVWAAVRTAATAGAARFLHPAGMAGRDEASLRADLADLAASSGGAIDVVDVPASAARAAPPAPAPPAAPALAARAFRGRIAADGAVTSFSGLAAHGPDPFLPDHDARPSAPPEDARPEGIHALPGGTRVGTMIHHLFERLDFAAAPGDVRAAVDAALARFGQDPSWAPALADMAAVVLRAPLTARDPSLRLAAVPAGRRLDELEFHVPVTHLTARGLRDVFRRHAARDAPPALPAAVEDLDFAPVRGFVKGFMDLVFEHGGRFWLVDYKSNRLGAGRSAYGPDALAAAMRDAAYFLQYHLYAVALHRYLRFRLGPRYDYDRSFGSVLYLFVRGMDAAAPPGRGVFDDRPPRALIEALSRYFETGEVAP